jgi:HD-GYP domain-containing protein (c-di-GMP phosphodiesterase class II)
MTLESDSDAVGGPGAGSQYRALYRYTKALSVALGYRDRYTRLHSDRVLALSQQIGIRAGLSERELGVLRIGASFHDIGKIGIPDHVLLKPTQLDQTEADEMKKHSELGENIILSTEIHGAEDVARVIRHHHENFDGMGYPDGLAGESIPVCSRIIGIADSYDAMALTRSYHLARSHREIVEIMSGESGRKHDRDLLRLFLEIIEESDYRAVEP